MIVYLSGGFYSGWQDKVMDACEGHIFIDPRRNNTKEPKEYTALDMEHICSSDIVFGCWDMDNPCDIGIACEVGYGKGCNCLIILVNEHTEEKYYALVENMADISFDNLDDGIDFLQKLQI